MYRFELCKIVYMNGKLYGFARISSLVALAARGAETTYVVVECGVGKVYGVLYLWSFMQFCRIFLVTFIRKVKLRIDFLMISLNPTV